MQWCRPWRHFSLIGIVPSNNLIRASHDHDVVDLSSFLFNLSSVAAAAPPPKTPRKTLISQGSYANSFSILRSMNLLLVYIVLAGVHCIVAERRRRATDLACVQSTALSPRRRLFSLSLSLSWSLARASLSILLTPPSNMRRIFPRKFSTSSLVQGSI